VRKENQKLNKKLGRNLGRLRTAANLTQEELAEKADMNSRHVQRIEAGQINPSFQILARLKKALKCKWEALLE